jgi:LEA14-like dessication related protein
VTGIEENLDDEIVTIMKIFNANGQSLQVKDLKELNTGLYILQGLTKDGRTVSKKVVVNK